MPMTAIAPVLTGLYAGILGVFALLLAIFVVAGRVKHRVEIGDGGKTDMTKRVRAFGNFAEYVPLIVALMALGEMLGSPRWLLHATGIAIVAGRLFHAWGLSRSTGTSAGRFVGTNLTWIALAAASIGLLIRAFALKPF
jgi:hypothetical protein